MKKIILEKLNKYSSLVENDMFENIFKKYKNKR